MGCNRLLTLAPWAGMLLCGLFLGCKEAKQVADLAKSVADPRMKGPMHERLKWKAEDFYTDPGVIQLCKAIEAKDVKEIDRLVKSGVDVNAKGRDNMTPLLWAFPMGEEVFKKMLELGADPNVPLTENTLVLFKGKSVTFACVELVDGLIYSQFFYDVPMDNYLTLVLKHGGNPNAEDLDGRTPLFTAIKFTPHAAIKIAELTRFGADINHRDAAGQTAVSEATGCGRYKAALTLLQAGADYRIPNSNGWDLILKLERKIRGPQGPFGQVISQQEIAQAQVLFDWLASEGVNWEAARAALKDQNLMKRLKTLRADYQHRPWLPQRPTLKKPDAKPEKP
jgi:uncharacterized protein